MSSLFVADGDKHLPHGQHSDPEPGPEAADTVARQGPSAHFQGCGQVRLGLPSLAFHASWGKPKQQPALPSPASSPGRLARGRSCAGQVSLVGRDLGHGPMT